MNKRGSQEPAQSTTVFDNKLRWLKNNKVFAVVLFIGVIVIGVANFTEAFRELTDILGLTKSSENGTPVAVLLISPLKGKVPLTVTADAGQSSDPEGKSLAFEWWVNDRPRPEARSAISFEIVKPGLHEVRVRVSDGTSGAEQSRSVTASEDLTKVPRASFDASVTSGSVPLLVHFEDRSEGEPLGWLWDFGDGSISREKNPSHTYRESSYTYQSEKENLCFREEPYTVILTVRNGKGEDKKVAEKLIKVQPETHSLTLQPIPYSLLDSAPLQHLPGHTSLCPTSGSLSGLHRGGGRATESLSQDEVGLYWEGQEVGLQALHLVKSGGATWVFRRWSGGLADNLVENERFPHATAHNTVIRLERSTTVMAYYEKIH